MTFESYLRWWRMMRDKGGIGSWKGQWWGESGGWEENSDDGDDGGGLRRGEEREVTFGS